MYKKWNWDQEIHFRGITRRLSNCCNLTSFNGSSSSFGLPVAYYDLEGLHLDDQKETSHLRQRWTGSRTWNNVISAKCTGYLEKMSLKSISSSRAIICINHFDSIEIYLVDVYIQHPLFYYLKWDPRAPRFCIRMDPRDYQILTDFPTVFF